MKSSEIILLLQTSMNLSLQVTKIDCLVGRKCAREICDRDNNSGPGLGYGFNYDPFFFLPHAVYFFEIVINNLARGFNLKCALSQDPYSTLFLSLL
jgi:hypothetical protein